MSKGLLLWVDDEIELLKAHIIFLQKKGYDVMTVSNGTDAIDKCSQQTFDLILLDEQMPGLSGLDTLQRIKEIQPATPVVMVTKSEEENIMDQAIGSKIADYLIKPVNPNQILLTLKKNIHEKEIVTEVTQSGYQQDYQQISMKIASCKSFDDWTDIYRKLVRWELELSSAESGMTEMLNMQKEEADKGFAKYVANNYLDWVNPQTRPDNIPGRPLMSPDLFRKKIFPLIDKSLGDGIEPGRKGRIPGMQHMDALRFFFQREGFRLQAGSLLSPKKGHAISLPVGSRGLGPKKAAGNRLVLIVHLVAIEADERKMEVQLLHIGRVPAGNEYGRCQILGGIACDDGQEAVQPEASAQEGEQECDSCNVFNFLHNSANIRNKG